MLCISHNRQLYAQTITQETSADSVAGTQPRIENIVYIQNEVINSNRTVTANNVMIGINVTPNASQGPVVITAGTTNIKAYNEAIINGVFEVKKGAVLNINE